MQQNSSPLPISWRPRAHTGKKVKSNSYRKAGKLNLLYQRGGFGPHENPFTPVVPAVVPYFQQGRDGREVLAWRRQSSLTCPGEQLVKTYYEFSYLYTA